ncbi:MAG: hypothetical protein WCF33_07950 [Pseudonocardiaceae bacterium]
MTARVLEAVWGLAGLSEVRRLVPVLGGHSHRMWWASTDGGDVLVKISVRHSELTELRYMMEHSSVGRPVSKNRSGTATTALAVSCGSSPGAGG